MNISSNRHPVTGSKRLRKLSNAVPQARLGVKKQPPFNPKELAMRIGLAARRIGIFVAAAGFMTVGLFSGTASAYTYSPTGSPGDVRGYTMAGTNLTVWDSGRTVQESPAYRTKDQRVCITTRLWTVVFAGAYTSDRPFWKLDRQHQRCGTIFASQTYIPDNGVAFTSVTPGKFYAVDVVVTWNLLNGTQIGTMTLDWNAATDYTCYSSATWRCSTGNVNFDSRDAFITFN